MIPRARLEDVSEADIQQLIGHGVREGRTLDFKDRLDLSKDGKQALAEDVCAFANTLGGDLVIGLAPADKAEGDTAVAKSIEPVHVDNLDATLLELVSSLRDSLEPQLATLHAHPIRLERGGHVIVLRVGASPSAPHRVVRRGGGHFFLRNSVGKEAMDIHAIRTAFAFADGLAERAFAFRNQRLDVLRGHQGPCHMPVAPLVVVHVVPALALTRRDVHPVEALQAAAAHLQRAKPVYYDLGPPQVNFEGVICSTRHEHKGGARVITRPNEPQVAAYAQLFREGHVEVVGVLDEHPETGTLHINPVQYERPLVQHGLPVIAQALTSMDVPAPAYLFLSLLRVHGLRVGFQREGKVPEYPLIPSNLSEIVSGAAYVESFDGNWIDAARLVFDPIWNAVGVEQTQTNFARDTR